MSPNIALAIQILQSRKTISSPEFIDKIDEAIDYLRTMENTRRVIEDRNEELQRQLAEALKVWC